MALRRRRRDQWRHLKTNGTWTCSLGHRGCRVRLFQIEKDGTYYREVRRADGSKDRRTMKTRDRDEAEKLGRQLLAVLLQGDAAPAEPHVVRLGELADAFVAESPTFLDNAAHTKVDQRIRIAILRAVIGEARDVRTLTENDVRQYEARRRSGGIRYGEGKTTEVVRQRSVQADVKMLKQMLRWACTRAMPDGQRWLDRNPLEYVRVQGERDVRRPSADSPRYEATLAAMRALQERYAAEARTTTKVKTANRAETRRAAWLRAEFALWLLHRTGRRRGAVMGLRWADVDFDRCRVTWRPEHDKVRRTWVVPYPQEFFDTVRDYQRRMGSGDGFIFARGDNPDEATSPELLYQWIIKAEQHAGLPKLKQGGTHPYRRAWASARRHLPLKPLMVAGGWSDHGTMLRCYDQPDDTDMLEVTSASWGQPLRAAPPPGQEVAA